MSNPQLPSKPSVKPTAVPAQAPRTMPSNQPAPAPDSLPLVKPKVKVAPADPAPIETTKNTGGIRYRISHRASLLHVDELLQPGTLLTKKVQAELTKKQIDEKVRLGFLIPIYSNDPDFGVDPELPLIGSTQDLGTKEQDKNNKELMKLGSQGQKLKAQGIWNYNPERLKGRSLEQLNILIIDTNPEASIADNVDDAIAMLSMDYRG